MSAEGTTQVAVVVAASRVRHPLDARTLARLAAHHAGEGRARSWASASATTSAGASPRSSPGVPHRAPRRSCAGAACRRAAGPAAVETTLESLWPDRLGHGVRSAEDPRVLELVAESGVALEVCPRSNIALGVYAGPEEVPLRAILDAGVPVALGADDPLLFGSRLAAQYDLARDALGFTDAELARLAGTRSRRAGPRVAEEGRCGRRRRLARCGAGLSGRTTSAPRATAQIAVQRRRAQRAQR